MSEKVMHKIENINEKVKKNKNASTGSHCGKNNHTDNSSLNQKLSTNVKQKGILLNSANIRIQTLLH